MKRLAVSLTLIVGLSLPAAASDVSCTTVDFTHREDGQVHIVDFAYDDYEVGPYHGLVGYFIWFQWAETPSSDQEETLSFDVSDPDVESAVACSDGSVTINRTPEPEPSTPEPTVEAPDPQPEPELEPEVVSLAPYCDTHPDTLERYCLLPNRTLVF